MEAIYSNHGEIEKGDLIWQVMNLHCYEKHFHLVK
jgi:thymidylate synthase